jgi:hypothetical protein
MTLAIAAAHSLLHVGLDVEDGAISFSYARTLAEGGGIGHLFPNAPKAEGYSNLLWVLALAGAHGVGLPIVGTAKVLGLVCMLGTSAVGHALAWRLLPDRRWIWLAGLSGAVAASAVWAVSGLENSLYSLLVLLSAYLVLREDRQGQADRPSGFPWSAVALFFLAVTRPEGVLYAAVAVGHKTMRARRANLGRLALFWIVFAVPYQLYLVWHWAEFGALLPNTVTAKDHIPGMHGAVENLWSWSSPGWVQVRAFFHQSGLWLLVPPALVGLLVAMWRQAWMVAGAVAVGLALPLYAPDWMPQFRFLFAVPTAVIVLAAIGLDRLSRWIPPIAVAVAACAVGLVVVQANAKTTGDLRRGGHAPFLTMQFANGSYQPLQRTARSLGMVDPLYVVPDVGGSTFLGNMRVLDSAGLADVQLARGGFAPNVTEPYIFTERLPDFVSTHSPWTEFLQFDRMDALRRDYVRMTDPAGPVAQYVRRDLVIDPARAGTRAGLVGSTMLRAGGPGGRYGIDLWWAGPTRRFEVSLLDAAGAVVATTGLRSSHYDWLSPSALRPSDAVRQYTELRLPDAPGVYVLQVAAPRVLLRAEVVVGPDAVRQEARRLSPLLDHAISRLAFEDAARQLAILSIAADGDRRLAPIVDDLRRKTADAIAEVARTGAFDAPGPVARAIDAIRLRVAPTSVQLQAAAHLSRQARDEDDLSYRLLVVAVALAPDDARLQARLFEARRSAAP